MQAFQDHQASFYDSTESYLLQTCDYLVEGAERGQSLLVAAESSNWEMITRELRRRNIPVEDWLMNGELIYIDVNVAILQLVENDTLNEAAFQALIPPILSNMLSRNKAVRVYGEIVNTLVERDQWHLAHQLEVVWHKLREQFDFQLRCGYNLGLFNRPEDLKAFDSLCFCHGELIDPSVKVSSINEIRLSQRDQMINHSADVIRASQKMASIGKVSSEMAHELLNPLSIAVMHTDLIEVQLNQGELAQDSVLKFVQSQRKQLLRLVDIIENVRACNKKLPLKMSLIRLDKLIHRVVNEQIETFKIDQVSIAIDFDLQIEVEANQTALEQVFLNLLTNARDAIKMKGSAGEIRIQASYTDQGLLTLQVIDNGIGIDSNSIQKIFTPFYTTKTEGTGIGLPLSRSVMREHGGNLTCNSIKNTGTTMTVSFPLVKIL
ncbi:MAG: ATP-binding protein [Bacteriovoracia bacterium]